MERPVRSLKRWKDVSEVYSMFALTRRFLPPPEDPWTPGRLLRALRRGAGRSQAALAELAGIRQTDVSAIEGGRVSPRWDTLAALFSALGAEAVLLARSRGWEQAALDDDDELPSWQERR